MQDKPYQSILGALLYIATRTRPDLTTAGSLLGKFRADPGPQHWRMLRHLVRYVTGTTDYGLLFPRLEDAHYSKSEKGQGSARNFLRTKLDLLALFDANWARDLASRMSRNGFPLTRNCRPIVWYSRLQYSTTESTTKAKRAALHVWARIFYGSEVSCPRLVCYLLLQQRFLKIIWELSTKRRGYKV